MSDNRSGVTVLTQIAAEMREGIATLAGDRAWAETRQRWIERAARAAGISYRAAKAMFYGEDHDPSSATVERVRRAVAQRKITEEANRGDTNDILSRLAFLERRLASIDPDFHCSDLEAIGAASHSARPQTD
jgi:hypothetical protein